MNPVGAAELASIQADLVKAVCDKTCVVEAPSGVAPDGYGSKAKSYSPVATTVAGMSQPTAGELQNYAYVIEDKAAWKVHLPIGTVVAPQYRLVIEGQTLEVHILLTPQSYPGLLDVIAAELKP